MKYVRTKDGRIGKVISVRDYNGSIPTFYHVQFANDEENYNDYELDIISQADTIEELCDEFVYVASEKDRPVVCYKPTAFHKLSDNLYGAIWTDKGLKYFAKMNDKGELELL